MSDSRCIRRGIMKTIGHSALLALLFGYSCLFGSASEEKATAATRVFDGMRGSAGVVSLGVAPRHESHLSARGQDYRLEARNSRKKALISSAVAVGAGGALAVGKWAWPGLYTWVGRAGAIGMFGFAGLMIGSLIAITVKKPKIRNFWEAIAVASVYPILWFALPALALGAGALGVLGWSHPAIWGTALLSATLMIGIFKTLDYLVESYNNNRKSKIQEGQQVLGETEI